MGSWQSKVNVPLVDAEYNLTVELGVPSEELIFGVASMIGASLIALPYESIDGNPIPTVIFSRQPEIFHAFVLALLFAFSGAVSTISLREEFPKVARLSRRFSVVSMVATLAILMWVFTLASLRFVASLV